MALLDNLFSKNASGKAAATQDSGPAQLSIDDDQAADRKSQRMERRELLYAVVRESMARIGMLSSSYKFKVLSLDSRGSQYLIMMDLPKETAGHIPQLAEIEDVVKQTATIRHQIDVSAVYWRINDLTKTPVLRKPRTESELGASRPAPDLGPVIESRRASLATAGSNRRFEPIRPDEVHAFKQALSAGVKTKPPAPPGRGRAKPATDFAPTEFKPTEFDESRDDADRLPLSRTQYGDLI